MTARRSSFRISPCDYAVDTIDLAFTLSGCARVVATARSAAWAIMRAADLDGINLQLEASRSIACRSRPTPTR